VRVSRRIFASADGAAAIKSSRAINENSGAHRAPLSNSCAYDPRDMA
jgi:hypothetical protein